MLSPNLMSTTTHYYLALFVLGPTMSVRMFITYPWLMECLNAHTESKVSDMLFFTDGFVYIVSPMILRMITTDTQMLVWIALGMCLISAGMMIVVR